MGYYQEAYDAECAAIARALAVAADGREVLPAQVRHALTGVYLKSTDNRPDDHWTRRTSVGLSRRGTTCLSTVPGRAVGESQGGHQEGEA